VTATRLTDAGSRRALAQACAIRSRTRDRFTDRLSRRACVAGVAIDHEDSTGARSGPRAPAKMGRSSSVAYLSRLDARRRIVLRYHAPLGTAVTSCQHPVTRFQVGVRALSDLTSGRWMLVSGNCRLFVRAPVKSS